VGLYACVGLVEMPLMLPGTIGGIFISTLGCSVKGDVPPYLQNTGNIGIRLAGIKGLL